MNLAWGKQIGIAAIGLIAVTFSGISSANPCALSHLKPYEEGIGGTGKQPVRQEGIGGTGHSEGLGGTGAPVLSQKMTVVGVITGFASVCINGLEIHFDDSTRVYVDDRITELGILKVGQIAQVEITDVQGRLTASAMQIHHEVIGPVDTIDLTSGVIDVVGQRLRISNTSAGVDLKTLSAGDNVRVSGFKIGHDEIIVTRIEPANEEEAVHLRSAVSVDLSGKVASLQGVVEQVGESGVRLVGWPTIALSEKLQKPEVGDIVHLIVDNLANKHPDIIEIEKIELDEIHARAGNLEIDYEIIEHYEHEKEQDAYQGDELNQAEETEETESGDLEFHAEDLETQEELESQEQESYETPEYEVPEDEEVEIPETPEYETPEYEAPELPETPEYEPPELPEAPEFEAPELPEAPEYEPPELPEAPEYEAPELPEAPEYEEPELPEADEP